MASTDKSAATDKVEVKGAKKDEPGNSEPAQPIKVEVPASAEVVAPTEAQKYVKVFKVLARTLGEGYSHDGNITATRQEAINSGFTPVSDVVFVGKKAEPGESDLPDRKKSTALTYSVEVVLTTLAGGAVHQ